MAVSQEESPSLSRKRQPFRAEGGEDVNFNRVSQGLYMRHGLFPKIPIYFFDAARKQVMKGLPEPPLRSIPIDASARTMERLAEIDFYAIGVSRDKHHRYLLNDPAITGVLLCVGGEVVGYS